MIPVCSPPTASPLASFSFEPKLRFHEIQDCLPPALANLSLKSQQIMGIAPETCAIAGLAHLAASYGRHILMDDSISQRPPSFNFLAVHDQPCSSDWLGFIGKGWIDSARIAKGVDLAILATRTAQDQTEPGKVKARHPSKLLPLPEGAIKSVTVLATCIDPAQIGRLLQQSPDAYLTLLNGANDPLEELAARGDKARCRLHTMLRESWLRKPVHTTLKDDTAIDATLGCLWTSARAAALRSLFRPGHHSRSYPPPMLLHRVSGNPLCYPNGESPEALQWQKLLHERFAVRGKKSEVIPMVFRSQAEQYAQELRAAINKQAALHQPWLEWTIDLLPRIFTLLWSEFIQMWAKQKSDKIAERLAHLGGDPSGHFATLETKRIHDQVEATIPKDKLAYILPRSIRLTTWMIQEHHAALKTLVTEHPETRPPDKPDKPDKPDTPDTECVQEAILQRLSSSGPLFPRDLQRSFHQMQACKRDDALSALKSRGLVIENADGRVSLPA